jgi:hypothetical protein
MKPRINIKREEARLFADEICAKTGETITQAVTEALRERLEILRQIDVATLRHDRSSSCVLR